MNKHDKRIKFRLAIAVVVTLALPDQANSSRLSERVLAPASAESLVGEKIQGDFNGDGRIETATVVLLKKGKGNPVEDGTPDEYQVQFSDPKIKPLNIGCCAARLVNEHDLNGDGADDISICQAPMNGCTYTMTTYTLTISTWKKLVKPFLIPTGCESISDKELQQRVFQKSGTIYYYDTNVNRGKWIKKKVIVP